MGVCYLPGTAPNIIIQLNSHLNSLGQAIIAEHRDKQIWYVGTVIADKKPLLLLIIMLRKLLLGVGTLWVGTNPSRHWSGS